MKNFMCIGINGFAGDRTPEAMIECHDFVRSFSEHFNFPFKCFGEPSISKDLPWNVAIVESKNTFDTAAVQLEEVINSEHLPILITPRCATAIATLPVVVANHPDVVVLYFDAHGDLNTPDTSDSGYLGGMPITAALGEWDSGYGAGLKSENLIHIGGRDIDTSEQSFIDRNNITTISKSQIEGDMSVLKKMIKHKPVFIHLDTDVYDPLEVTAEYAVSDGLFRNHVKKIVDIVLSEGRLVGLEITELSPKTSRDRQQSYDSLFESLSGLTQISMATVGK